MHSFKSYPDHMNCGDLTAGRGVYRTPKRPLLLDLFCSAGGASYGYYLAGFDVIGVDIERQKNYPFGFIKEDVLEWLPMMIDSGRIERFDVIAGSPPCQEYSRTKKLAGDHPDLVAPFRKLLMATGKPYIIENVPGAPLENPVMLNGVMFGLRVNRPRLFECFPEIPFFLLPSPMPQAKMGRPPRFDGDFIQVVGNFSGVEYARSAMEISWMTRDELSQAIPPAYTRWLGTQMLKAIGWVQ